MVFYCRCFSFAEEEIEYETTTQLQSAGTQTFYTASSDFHPSVSAGTQTFYTASSVSAGTQTFYTASSDFHPSESAGTQTFYTASSVSAGTQTFYTASSVSAGTQTFYTASSDFHPSGTDSQAKASLFSNNLRVFTFSELKAATNNFSLSAKIGEGGFGCVYKGAINNPRDSTKTLHVAVKHQKGSQGHREWVSEVNYLGLVQHPNLVKLVGYCAEDDERLLVYEYMPNRSVKDHLSRRSEAPLSWTMRLKVAQDVARGLTYLHEEMDFQIIFRDLKPSNILLDDQWNAKLSDFGWVRLGPEEGHSHVSSGLKGTDEYMSPEYIATGHLTSKNDIWSYGVFLFELITGRHPLDWRSQPENEYELLEWVKPYIGSKGFNGIIDPRLEGKYSLKSANKLASIATQCLSIEPKSRPKMSEVLQMVDQLITGVPSPLNSLVSVVAIEPKMVIEKTPQNMKTEGKTGSTETQRKETACFPLICCSGGPVQ